MAFNLGDAPQVQANDRTEFLKYWAKKYFDTIDWIEGNESGGIDPPRNPQECFVKNDNTVIIKWNLPPTTGAGIVNPPYHVTDYARIRTDELVFEDGRILENGEDMLQRYQDGRCFRESKDKAVEFQQKYAAASKLYDMKYSTDLQRKELAEKLETLDVVKDFLEYPVGVVDDETKDARLNHYANLLRENDRLQKAEAKAINWGHTEGYKSARRDIHKNEKEISAWEKKLLNVYSPKDVANTKKTVEEEIERRNAEFAKWNNPSSDDMFADFE